MITMTAQDLINGASIILQKTGKKPGITKPTQFDGIEQVLVFKCELNKLPAIARPTEEYLSNVGVDVEKMWGAALQHVEQNVSVLSFAEMFGMEDVGMKALTFKTGAYGAAAILAADKVLAPGTYFAIPSSVHEFIVTPYGENGLEEDGVTEIIRAVNAGYVEEWEQLGDHVYVLEV